jgi:peptidoglycan hydrolase-like protein with peptidoglycan-binding domain
MPYSLTWLPHVLKAAGLKVAPHPGWENRGRGEMGKVMGVICHHTGDTGSSNMPSLNVLVRGRSDLPGPLAQLGLGRDGTFYIIAAGRCNHAGPGNWRGLTQGNTDFIGIEAENKGNGRDKWPAVQMDAYHRGVAAILKHVGRGVEFCIGHKEWARERTVNKKYDPTFDMNEFRTRVSAVLTGAAAPLTLIPAVEPPTGRGGAAGRPTLRRGMTHPLVAEIQAKLQVVPVNGQFGPKTEAAVRAFQRGEDMVPDGIVGPKTWAALDDRKAPPPKAATDDVPLAWGKKVDAEFKRKVRAISAGIGCDPNYLMACMAFESGESFSPSMKNMAGSGATGLIQFMPSTAKGLGTTTEALARMTAVQQLDYVERYFKSYPNVRTIEDVYMAILWPRAIGKPNDYVLFASPTKQYKQNSGLDQDRDGKITKFEAAAAVRAKLSKGRTDKFIG